MTNQAEVKSRKSHWESVYASKNLEESSWYEALPGTSLSFLADAKLPSNAKIIDIGGGDSLFADHLLKLGYTDITVLDISELAIARARKRLGKLAEKIKWIIADAARFTPIEKYDFWHDRAAFHFLTSEEDIQSYIEAIGSGLNDNGLIVIGTFSENGPTKCSGIEIRQYSPVEMADRFRMFEKQKCLSKSHLTPAGNIQDFTFCSFRKAV